MPELAPMPRAAAPILETVGLTKRFTVQGRITTVLDSFDYGHIHGRAGVGPIAFRTLGGQMLDPGQWGLLVPISATIVIVALATGPRKLALFALVWTLVSWLGLSWIYVISHYEYSYYLDSTKERVVASIVVGLAALTPLIAAEAWTGARGIRRVRAVGD